MIVINEANATELKGIIPNFMLLGHYNSECFSSSDARRAVEIDNELCSIKEKFIASGVFFDPDIDETIVDTRNREFEIKLQAPLLESYIRKNYPDSKLISDEKDLRVEYKDYVAYETSPRFEVRIHKNVSNERLLAICNRKVFKRAYDEFLTDASYWCNNAKVDSIVEIVDLFAAENLGIDCSVLLVTYKGSCNSEISLIVNAGGFYNDISLIRYSHVAWVFPFDNRMIRSCDDTNTILKEYKLMNEYAKKEENRYE